MLLALAKTTDERSITTVNEVAYGDRNIIRDIEMEEVMAWLLRQTVDGLLKLRTRYVGIGYCLLLLEVRTSTRPVCLTTSANITWE
ncbi:hypothetical protein V6N13_068225 [Hibiscus sabdariffa]|uniref:Uncharacterized protein n=2 Tax=Hibiscus sabdariffa TaxID=183260 RepID=A0ABR2ALI8_9ROSI